MTAAPFLDVDAFHGKAYDRPPCWQLAADVYANVLGAVVGRYELAGRGARAAAAAMRLALHEGSHGFTQLAAPRDFALVLMGRTARLGLHHCGVYWRGSVLHATDTGTHYTDLAALRREYPLMEFWAL